MTNKEKFAKEILDIACTGSGIAMDLNGNLVPCIGLSCGNCKFNDADCDVFIEKWCKSEYVEKYKISESDRRFLDYIPDYYKYMIRNESGSLFVYKNKPMKDNICAWHGGVGSSLNICKEYKVSFPMVKWEDDEPWSIEDLKKLEVEA